MYFISTLYVVIGIVFGAKDLYREDFFLQRLQDINSFIECKEEFLIVIWSFMKSYCVEM